MVMSVYGSQEGMGHLGMALCDEEIRFFCRIPAILCLPQEV